MKAVLMSIKPKWCEKIANGEKTIEVRKSRPKLETPFKVYIYCTNTPKYHHLYDLRPFDKSGKIKLGCVQHNSTSLVADNYINGKVICEFVCDKIDEFHSYELDPSKRFYDIEKERLDLFLKESCLYYDEVCEYRKNLPYIKPLYGWRIADLKIYDKPKELSEFFTHMGKRPSYMLERPPQSWCYVEELQND